MQAGKTGIIYDPRMMDHRSKRKHPEKPQRVKGIINKLGEEGYLEHPRIEYISTIVRNVEESDLELAHKKKYIKHVQNLWPKTSHRTDITVLDTYFNEHSELCAKIAVAGVLDGIDRVMSGHWENGFAVVRPPGHHSGQRNTINGFCVYNNVAVGARYLIQSTFAL